MGNSFRQQPAPALYGENKTAVSEDLLEVGLLVAFGIIAFSFILIIPGIRGWERLWATIRVFVALWVGAAILVSNFSYAWYKDTQCVRTQYKAYIFPPNSHQEIEAEVGIHIGLRGFNVTLHEMSLEDCRGSGGEYERPFPGEEIDYNEQFFWADPWAQGRLGFGQFAGRVSQEFRAAQFRGMPYPILWIAEYFTLDGEQIRWGRKFRLAGWYAHIFLWLAFATYLVSILLFIFVIRLGAWFMIITALVMIMACFSYGLIIINDPEFEVPFANNSGVVLLKPEFSWSFYLTLLTGIVTLILGVVILAADYFVPRKIAVVFHHSIVEEDEFFLIEEEEEEKAGLEEYGVATKGSRRGETGRVTRGGRTTKRHGLSRYRQTQRKPRSTVRSSRGGSQRLEHEIQLEEISAQVVAT